MLIHITATGFKNFIITGFLIIIILICYSGLKKRHGSFGSVDKKFLWTILKPKKPNKPTPASQTQLTKPKSKGELATCQAMELLFGKPFYSARPEFLKSPITGQNLELDCYNHTLNLGAEYNGRQHYYYTPKFHKSVEDFRNGQYRDYIKQVLCEKNGTRLINVPYTIPQEKIKDYILKSLEEPSIS